MITISDSAAKKIKSIIDEEDSSLKLRVFVQGGGCSGFQYGFSLEELPPADDDFTFNKDGIGVVIDSMSMQYMNEAEIDYKEDLMGASFTIKNPNATATCGCGSSFTV
jgi:iron-sulfur cluster insertion protein